MPPHLLAIKLRKWRQEETWAMKGYFGVAVAAAVFAARCR
jgi:hypothetical protein